MSFNRGWLCSNCGPVPESKKRSINKIQYDTCKQCGEVVTPWERPLKERAGRCGNCGHGAFVLAIHKKQLLRKCKFCGEVTNPDSKQIMRKGRAVK